MRGRTRLAATAAAAVAVALAGAAGTACGLAGGETEARADGTVRMAERLAELRDSLDPERNEFLNRRRVEFFREKKPPDPLPGYLMYHMAYGVELVRAGRWEEARGVFSTAEDTVAAYLDRVPVPASYRLDLMHMVAASHLREGVERNCVSARRPERCLLPLAPAAAYPGAGPSRRAARAYRDLLEFAPEDLLARWHLNVAHMTLGEWPEGVPERWRLPPSTFESEAEIGRFRDLAPALDLDVLGLSGGVAMEDMDGDGDQDLLVSSSGRSDQLRYFENRGDGGFVERTARAGLTGLVGGLNLAHADYDGDGDADVLVLRGGWAGVGWPNSLLRNEGDGTFSDVTEEAGLLSLHPTQTAGWADFDGDGDLDLFVGNETRHVMGSSRHPAELYRNEGDGTFTEIAGEAGLDVTGMVKAVTWGDYDNDGRPDLYVSRLGGRNLLFRNLGPDRERGWRFEEVGERAGVGGPEDSFPAWFWDYDNDGWLDLVAFGFRAVAGDVAAEHLGRPLRSELPRLYRNQGDGTFTDVTEEAGLARFLYAMGSNFGDLDNDGWPDMLVGTGAPDMRLLIPNRAFRNEGGRRFREVTAVGGLGHVGKGHGVAFGDVDNDGDQDAYVVLGGAYEGDLFRNALYENPGHGNDWITLRLEGTKANRSGIGARIRVLVETDGDGGTREIHAVAGTGGSFGSSTLQQEIGLGRAAAVRTVEIRWPGSGAVDAWHDVDPNRVYRAREGAPELEPVPARPYRLAGGRGGR